MNHIDKIIKSIAKGIIQVIDSYGLVDELPDGRNTNLVPNLNKLFRNEFGWAFSKDPDLAADMIMEWFQLVYIQRADSVFKGYIPSWKKGHKAPLLGYLTLINRRAAQEISKKYYRHYKKFIKEIAPMEGETVEDAFQRIVQNPTKKQGIKTMDDDEIQELEEMIEYYRGLLELEDNSKRKEGIKKRIEVLKKKLDDIISNQKKINDVEQYLDNKLSVDDELAFEEIVEGLRGIIRNRQDYEIQIKLLELLLAGFSPSEIAKLFKVSSAKISQRKKKLIQDIEKLADYYKSKGDDSLYKFLQKYRIQKANTKFGYVVGNRNIETDRNVLLFQANKILRGIGIMA